jgi:tRNA threonylcarbamoyladenosine modification (KEOPS) complex  Pcc1 subunit
MIEQVKFTYDPVLAALLESNDHEFSGGRAKLTIQNGDEIVLTVESKDETAHRAMITSINNTKKILDKAKKVL